jgi:hypothetical protein
MHRSFSYRCFHYVVATTWVWQNCFIFYHLMLHSNLFTCRLKGPVKQETCDMTFFFISMFSLCSSYNCVCTVVFTKTPWLKPVPTGAVYAGTGAASIKLTRGVTRVTPYIYKTSCN